MAGVFGGDLITDRMKMKNLFLITVTVILILLGGEQEGIGGHEGVERWPPHGKCSGFGSLRDQAGCEVCRARCRCHCLGGAIIIGTWTCVRFPVECGPGSSAWSLCSSDNTFEYTRRGRELVDPANCNCLVYDACSGAPAGTACPWLDDLINRCTDEEIIVRGSQEFLSSREIESQAIDPETARINRADVPRLEDSLGMLEGGSTSGTIGMWAMEDSTRGDFMRSFLDRPDPYTYDAPRTREFFDQIDQIQGTSECNLMKQIYETATSAVPHYGASDPSCDPLQQFDTFEQMLTTGAGICRNNSALLIAALERRGIEADFVSGPNHAWVRVTLGEEGPGAGREIDLDPTWYQSFIPLTKRVDNLEINYCLY